jgi:hypothetical protein
LVALTALTIVAAPPPNDPNAPRAAKIGMSGKKPPLFGTYCMTRIFKFPLHVSNFVFLIFEF